jgi:hypothetical protein
VETRTHHLGGVVSCRNNEICCSVNENVSKRRAAHRTLPTVVRTSDRPCIQRPTRSKTRNRIPYGPRTAVLSCSQHGVGLKLRDDDAVDDKRSSSNVDPGDRTVMPSSRQQKQVGCQYPPAMPLEYLCSHRSEGAKPCQDGMVIRERSKRSKANVCKTIKQLTLSTEPPTSQLGSLTRDTHLQDACLAGVPRHALIRGRSERSDARQQTRVNIKYVTKVTCHAIIIKHVCTFATKFTGPVHLQGQVVHSQVLLCFLSFFISSLLAGSSGFFN